MQEGFQPATFRSSRSDRAQVKAQQVDDYLDEDERRERGKATLSVKVRPSPSPRPRAAHQPARQHASTPPSWQRRDPAWCARRVVEGPERADADGVLHAPCRPHLTQGEYDTFGSAAAEAARAQSQRDAELRPSLIPGPAIAELITPVAASLGAPGCS